MLAFSAALMVLLHGCSRGSATPDAGPLDAGMPFDWTLEGLPPEAMGCGDGILEQGESCDDANHDGADGCDACQWAALCGNGVIEGEEACDDGNRRNGDGCRASCEEEVCGDGAVDAPAEACDGDGACVACAPTVVCGDGELAANEGCDDGNAASWDGCSGGLHARVRLPAGRSQVPHAGVRRLRLPTRPARRRTPSGARSPPPRLHGTPTWMTSSATRSSAPSSL
ncbi:MAG: DUF4215 domain-containing protein [Sandaracinaceae bacterium]|nr:DUF4215 domain-containing protein [Sandaracinaceae bacterium]